MSKQPDEHIKLNLDMQSDHLIQKDYDKYLQSQVDGLVPKFKGVNKADNAILTIMYYEFYKRGLPQNHTLKDAIFSSILFT